MVKLTVQTRQTDAYDPAYYRLSVVATNSTIGAKRQSARATGAFDLAWVGLAKFEARVGLAVSCRKGDGSGVNKFVEGTATVG